MTSRYINHQERKDTILGIVIEEYIKTSTPISSSHIAQEYSMDLSSATIRNILAELESYGHLTHPHTSAGRVPTQIGYRYYVDNLMKEIQLLEAERKKIQGEYKKGIAELEGLLEKTTEIISELTHYTTFVSVDGVAQKVFCRGSSFVVDYPQYHDLNKIGNILRMLEEKKRLLGLINRDLEKKIEFYIGQEISCSEIDECSLAISSFKKENGPSGRIAVLGPTRMDYERVGSTLDYVTSLIEEIL